MRREPEPERPAGSGVCPECHRAWDDHKWFKDGKAIKGIPWCPEEVPDARQER